MRRFAAFAMTLAAGAVLGGCHLVHGVEVARESMGNRCADLLKAAMPSASIRIDTVSARNTGIDTIAAGAAGTRTDLPHDSTLPRNLAIQCDFYDGVLSGFHWTKGGPPQ